MQQQFVLDAIGTNTRTDKCSNGHNYLNFYENFLQPIRHEQLKVVEIGIGGYEYLDRGGESLHMWDQYFTHPDTRIIGIDLYEKVIKGLSGRVSISMADQTNYDHLTAVVGTEADIDVMIDDASHINPYSMATFEIMFGLVKPGGIYIWEDIHTSLWEKEYQGNPVPMEPGTALFFLSRLMYGLQVDTMEEQYRSKWDGHIESMHFMRNTCVIRKRK